MHNLYLRAISLIRNYDIAIPQRFNAKSVIVVIFPLRLPRERTFKANARLCAYSRFVNSIKKSEIEIEFDESFIHIIHEL